jgi:ribonuclease HI
MPWIRARLRGTIVYARADASGALSPAAGRVEIRYKPNDGKLYRANASNLTIVDPTPLPDETCGEAKEPEKDDAAGRRGAKAGGARASAEVITPDGCWEAWTDGACSGNPGPAGLGIVLFDDEHRTEISEYLGHATNNVAELTAVLRALERIPRTQPAVIRTDSQYSIGVLQKGWKAKANTELVASVKRELAGRPSTRLVYTPGHAGVSFNERADQLARMAVSTRSSSVRSYSRKPA